MTDIQYAMRNAVAQRGKKAPFETPVRKEKGGGLSNPLERENVPEKIRSEKKRLHLAVSAGKKTIRFLQNRGCPALGALVFDLNARCRFH
jgi:hypothetical protein